MLRTRAASLPRSRELHLWCSKYQSLWQTKQPSVTFVVDRSPSRRSGSTHAPATVDWSQSSHFCSSRTRQPCSTLPGMSLPPSNLTRRSKIRLPIRSRRFLLPYLRIRYGRSQHLRIVLSHSLPLGGRLRNKLPTNIHGNNCKYRPKYLDPFGHRHHDPTQISDVLMLRYAASLNFPPTRESLKPTSR